MDNILGETGKGDADRRLHMLTTIIISLTAEKFGIVEKRGTKTPYVKNCWAEKISQIRQGLHTLKHGTTIDFNTKEPRWKEIQEVVKASRASSAPRHSGVPYNVY